MNPIDLYYSLAKNIYGEDRVFLDIRGEKRGYVAIHFPELTINNSAGRSHDITDLYVRSEFKSDGRMMGQIHGTRTTVTALEAHNEYLHSHLRGSSVGKWNKFCVGSGSEISQAVANAAFNSFKDSAELHFSYLLHYLPIYTSWESIEGKPWKYIKYLINQSSGSVSISNYEVGEFVNACINNIVKIYALKINYSKTYPFIYPIYDKNLELFMKLYTPLRENVAANGVYLGTESIDQLAHLANDRVKKVNICGKLITCKITHNEETKKSENNKIDQRVPEKLKAAFIAVFTERLSIWAARSYPDKNKTQIVKRGRRTSYIRGAILKDILPV